MRKLDEIKLTPNDRQALEAAARLLRERFPVEELILFGSKARGDDDVESDLDLLVLTSRSVSWNDKRAMWQALDGIGDQFNVMFSPLVIPREEWLNGLYQVLPIRTEVDQDGVVV